MIEPLASEKEWAPIWEGAKPWQPPDLPMLVVSPHPDDETLGAGGLIGLQAARGIPLLVVAVTDGENAYRDGVDIADRRSQEQTSALGRLGVTPSNLIRLKLTDSGVTAEEELLVERLMPLVSKTSHIVAPWTGDYHPDHQACGRAAVEVARRSGAALTFYFFWTWHCGRPDLLRNLSLKSLVLSAEFQHAKRKALSEHRSQLEHPSGEPILPDYLLWPARRPCEVFLPI
jgi:LmbE family N-acetylglucosaminyl deacetylase